MIKRRVIPGFAFGVAMLTAWPTLAATPIDLPGTRAFPESIASTSDGTLYVGRVVDGGIVRIRSGGSPEVWIKPGADGTRSVFGVLADEAGRRLWLCSNDASKLGVDGPSSVTGSWLKAFDLDSGKLVASAKLPGPNTFCNDIAVGRDGAAYVTNSLAPVVLRLKPNTDTLEPWASDPRFAAPKGGGAGLDGLSFDKNGNLIVDLFNKAELFRIDVRDGQARAITELAPTKKLTLADAIRPIGDGSFLLVEGGGSVDHLAIEGDKATVTVLKAGFVGPTGATIAGDTVWVSEGRLSQLHDQAAAARQPFRIYPVPLSNKTAH